MHARDEICLDWEDFKEKINQFDAKITNTKQSTPIKGCNMPMIRRLFTLFESGKDLVETMKNAIQFSDENLIQRGDYRPGEHTIGTYGLWLNGINTGFHKNGYAWKKEFRDTLVTLINELFTLMLSDKEFTSIQVTDNDKRLVLNRYLNLYVDLDDQLSLSSVWHMMMNQQNGLPLPDIFTINIVLKNIRYLSKKYATFAALELIDMLYYVMEVNNIEADDYTYNEIIWIFGIIYKTSTRQNEIQYRLNNLVDYYVETPIDLDIYVLQTIIWSFDKVGIRFTNKQMEHVVINLKQQHILCDYF